MIREQTNNGFKANPGLINKQAAYAAHAGTSFEPDKRGEQAISGFAEGVQAVYERLKPRAKTDAEKALLISEMERFQASYAQKYNDLLYSHSRIYSTMIAGPSGFPAERMRKINEAYDNKSRETYEWKDRAEKAMLRALKGLATEEAGGEVAVLKNKIAQAEKLQEMMVEANKIIRKKAEPGIGGISKHQQLINMGFTERQATEAMTPDYMQSIGFPAFALTNNSANIRRMKERLIELEKKEVTPTAEIPFTGGVIVDNREEDRVQIIFDQKPAQEVINKLRGEGWRWAPSVGAWSRKRTDMALNSARRILGLEVQAPKFIAPASVALEEEGEEPESQPTERDSTVVKRQIEAIGVKVLRAMIDPYNSGQIRLTVPTGTQPLPGELRREVARGFKGDIPSKTWVWLQRPKPPSPVSAPQPQVFVPAKEEPKIEDEVHARIQKVIDIIKIYRDKGATYEDLVAGLKGYYLQQSGYVMGSNLNVQKLTDDLKKSGYPNLRELWRAIIVQAPVAPSIPVPQPYALPELRWVYGTREGKWYLVGPEDRDYAHGITQARMKLIGAEAAKSEYLSPSLARAAAPVQPAMRYVPPKHPPLLYPAPPQRPAEEIMLVQNPEKMTRDEYIKEKYKRMAQVLRQQGKNAIAERVEKGARDPERTFKYETSHRDQVVLALAQNKAVSPEVLKDYPDIVGRIRKENEEILAKIKAERERIKAIERAEENELNAELNKLPPPLKRHAETEIYGTLHLPETHKDYPNRYYIALGKVRRIAFAHLPGRIEPQPLVQPQEPWQITQEEYWRAGAGGKAYEGRGTSDYNHKEAVYKAIIAGKPVSANVLKDYPDLIRREVPAPSPKIQTIQDIKQQVINSIQEAKSMDELKQILRGLGFLSLPESEKRQLIDLYQIRLSELMGGLKFGERIPEEEKKKRRAPQKAPYAPPTRRLEEYGIKEAMRRGYGYA